MTKREYRKSLKSIKANEKFLRKNPDVRVVGSTSSHDIHNLPPRKAKKIKRKQIKMDAKKQRQTLKAAKKASKK